MHMEIDFMQNSQQGVPYITLLAKTYEVGQQPCVNSVVVCKLWAYQAQWVHWHVKRIWRNAGIHVPSHTSLLPKQAV